MAAKAAIMAGPEPDRSAGADGCVIHHLVVGHPLASLDQEPLVLRIEDRVLGLIPGEAPDRLFGFPEGHQQKLRPIVDDAPKREHSAVSLRTLILGEAGLV